MLNQNTLDKMRDLKLMGMIEAWENIMQNNEHTNLSITEVIGMLTDHEFIYRKNKKLIRLLKAANLRYSNACIENMSKHGKINRNQLNQLQDTLWLHNKQNIIISGPTGVGKT